LKEGHGIVILGSGLEIDYIVRNLDRKRVPLLGYGPYSIDSEKNDLHRYCEKNSIPLITDHHAALELEPRFIFMLSYAPLIERESLQRCKFVNVHGALLPRFRGMHGGTWALINGEEQAGYTMHLVDSGIDSGPIYFQSKVEVGIEETMSTVREKILNKLKKNILSQLEAVYSKTVEAVPQDESQATYVCRRHPKDSQIDWNWSSKRVHDFIRALAPPYTDGAFTALKADRLYVTESEYAVLPNYYGVPGQVVNTFEDGSILVKTGDSALRIRMVVWQGEQMLPSRIFTRVGRRL
jgi:methionyl-tRNA formyltransferase